MATTTAIRGPTALADLLGDYSTEVSPRDRHSLEAAADCLPRGAEVFIPSAPGESAERLIAAAAFLRDAGLTPVPHITARSLPGLAAADRLIGRLRDEAGLDRALVLGGDRDRPAGELQSSLQLIQAGLFQKHAVCRLFIACYPEGHPSVPDAALEDARAAKLRIATDQGLEFTLVSQFCFEPGPIIALARRLRAKGVAAPYRVGVAGPAERALLVKYALMCGIGPSVRALARRQHLARNLLASETPEVLLTEVALARAKDPALGISGVHFFTFGSPARSASFAESLRR
jgi:methylenetetrahydrofolate reductase (NADPH)